MNRRIALSLLVGAVIAAAALYVAFRRVPVAELWRYFAAINFGWALPAMALILLAFVVRAVRWRIIVSSIQPITLRQAFHPLMIGFMINCVLPGRVGELARPMILYKRDRIPFVTGLATVAAERVFDLCLLVVLFAAVMSAVSIDPGFAIDFGGYRLNRETLELIFWGMVKLGLALVAGIVCINIDLIRKALIGLIRRAPALLFFTGKPTRTWVSQQIGERLVNLLERMTEGFGLVRKPRQIAACALASILVWILHGLSYYVFALGCPGVGLSFLQHCATMIIIMFFIALPSVPGYWGLWEAGGVFAMALFGAPAAEAAGFTLANHFVQVLPIVVVGMGSALVTSVNIWHVSYGGTSEGAGRIAPEEKGRG